MKATKNTENGFRGAVRAALNQYMLKETCDQQTLAGRLEVSPGMMSRYLNGTSTLGGDVLARACVDLGIAIDFHEKTIAATDIGIKPSMASESLQFSFDFEEPLTLEGKTSRLLISVKPVLSEKLELTLRVLPRVV
jgi:transcriptional regulator with XRE-family HTH domain